MTGQRHTLRHSGRPEMGIHRNRRPQTGRGVQALGLPRSVSDWRHPRRSGWLGFLLSGLLGLGLSAPCFGQAPLDQQASWETPTYEDARNSLWGWIADLEIDESVQAKIDSLWPEEGEVAGEVELLERVATTLEAIVPEAGPLVELTRGNRPRGLLPSFAVLDDDAIAAPFQTHLRLLFGRWLVQQAMFDEALVHFGTLEPDEVLMPATLLFHQSIAHHRLLQKEECLPKLAKLLENEAQLPRRYRELTRLMEADLRPLKEDSLDEIARIMDNVTRRLNLGRAGQRVRQEEDDVIAKLDKMIEDLEQQQQMQQQGGGGAQGQTPRSPSSPMEDSRAAGGSGPGNVTPRNIGRGSGWGNLPPKEREEAMQEITKNLPAHYRDVIEEYFRKLARTSN
jgi:hypothetical protein